MTRQEARAYALQYAYEAIQKALDCAPDDDGLTPDESVLVESELDKLTQRAFEVAWRVRHLRTKWFR